MALPDTGATPISPRTRGARRWTTIGFAGIVAAAVLAGGAVFPGSPASADPKARIAEVQAQVDALQGEAETASELANEANIRLAAVQARIVVLNKKLRTAQAAVGAASENVDAIARSTYTSGGTDGMLQALLADNPDDFLARAADLDAVSRSTNSDLRKSQSARLVLAQVQLELQTRQAEAAAAAKDASDQRAVINTKLAEAKRLLATLTEAERQRLAAIAEAQRQAAIKAARVAAARAAAEAAAQAARDKAARESRDNSNGNSSGSGSTSGGGGGGNYSSDRARAAVQAALAQVGESYSYSASPPNSWDCSKLTAWAWRQAGVSLTAYSFAQYNETRRVSRDELQPGDLLFFFGSGAHHVGMYIGGGQMVHAANPSSGVLISSINESWYASRYSGAGRPG